MNEGNIVPFPVSQESEGEGGDGFYARKRREILEKLRRRLGPPEADRTIVQFPTGKANVA